MKIPRTAAVLTGVALVAFVTLFAFIAFIAFVAGVAFVPFVSLFAVNTVCAVNAVCSDSLYAGVDYSYPPVAVLLPSRPFKTERSYRFSHISSPV